MEETVHVIYKSNELMDPDGTSKRVSRGRCTACFNYHYCQSRTIACNRRPKDLTMYRCNQCRNENLRTSECKHSYFHPECFQPYHVWKAGKLTS